MNDTQLRIGIIGINGRGRMSEFWHRPRGRSVVAGAADIRPEFLASFQSNVNPDSFTTLDYQELIARPDIDAIAVTSPDYCHEEQVVAALQAGKPVFCEKPMAITIEGCDRMIQASHESGAKLMVGFNMRYMTFVKELKRLMDEGAIGDLKTVWVRHMVAEGSLYYFHDWHARKENCTSLLLQKGSHDIDVIHYVTGRYTKRIAAFGGLDHFGGSEPNDLECDSCTRRDTCLEAKHHIQTARKPDRQHCCFRKEVDIEDNYLCLLELEGGIRANYNECHFTPDDQRDFTFIGTEGRIENNYIDNHILVWKRRNGASKEPDRIIDLGKFEDEGIAEVGHGGADQKIADAFVDTVLDGGEPPVAMEAGRMSVAAGVMGERSLESGGMPMEIPALPVPQRLPQLALCGN